MFSYVTGAAGGMFCYHCPAPPLHPTPSTRIPSIDYPFSSSHPCKNHPHNVHNLIFFLSHSGVITGWKGMIRPRYLVNTV